MIGWRSAPRWRLASALGIALLLGGAAREASAQGFQYAGIGLDTSLDSLAATLPLSRRVGSYLYVRPDEARHHVYGIEISAGEGRRVRLSFERRAEGDRPIYPACEAVQRDLAARYGEPVEVRDFAEEAMERSDRRWVSPSEVLTLVCFRGSEGLLAEAVAIHPRDPGR